jgi:NAD(P)-dependent dehydrogenase (short-subunit alcohol dehydrogenase family)
VGVLGDTAALVTGASQGIGAVIATTLGGCGASVVRAARSADADEFRRPREVNVVGPFLRAKHTELADVERAEPADISPDDFALADYVIDAEEVAYLASERGRHVTAQEIGVDAGGTWY